MKKRLENFWVRKQRKDKYMNARDIALQIINDTHVNQAYANVSLTRNLKKHADLSEQDRRFITELVYGTVKTSGTLEWILSCYISRPFDKIAPMIQDILKMGVYQLLYMTKVPESAACNQSVELAKKYGHAGTVKFVNAVLRNFLRNKEKAAFPSAEEDPVACLALSYHHPAWLIKRWLKRYGAEEVKALCSFDNSSAALSVRTNTLKTTREKLLQVLAGEGTCCRVSDWTPEGILCLSHRGMDAFHSLREGLFQVQDESSMLVAHILAPQPGEFIIDTCSAPGGKTTHIAALMKNEGKVLAVDIYGHKLARVEENARRLGISIIKTELSDAAEIGDRYPVQADRVLVDAPCSGLGVLRRKPDSRWRKTEGMLRQLPELQLKILQSAAKAVKPGGVLVYSTCTIEPEENQLLVEKFLRLHPEFVLETTGAYLPCGKTDAVMLQLLPQRDGVDGFFIARMKRKRQV